MKETDVRQCLVEALEADLVGPFVPDSHPQGGQEVLPIAPSRWYLTGFLAPQGARKPDDDDQDSVDGGLSAGTELQAEDAGSPDEENNNNKRPVRFTSHSGARLGQSGDAETRVGDRRATLCNDHPVKRHALRPREILRAMFGLRDTGLRLPGALTQGR
jgi:hypothetical protein